MRTKNVFMVSSLASAGLVRNRIMETAWILLTRYGYSKVTMDEIARELRMSKATLYKIFRDKDDLVQVLVESHLAQMKKGIEAIVGDAEKDFVGRMSEIMAFIHGHLSRIGNHFIRDIQISKPEIWETIDRFRSEKVFPEIRRLIEAGMREGVFRRDLNIELFFQQMTTVIQQIVTPTMLMSIGLTVPEAIRMLSCLWMEGILTEKSRKQFQRKRKMPRKRTRSKRGHHE